MSSSVPAIRRTSCSSRTIPATSASRGKFNEGSIANRLHVVGNGFEALDFLYQRGDYTDVPRPDIILLDLNLPRKDGDEVLDEIRDDADLEHLPVIILTSSEAQEDVVKPDEYRRTRT